MQIRTKAMTDFKEGLRGTDSASLMEVRDGIFAKPADVRFFGAFVRVLMDRQVSIPRRLLGGIMEIVANSYDVVG